MSRFEQWEKVDLQAGVQRFPVHGGFFTHDALGNRLGLIVTNGNDPVTLTGSIKGFAKLPPHTDDDVQIFEITGAIDVTDGSKAYVDLPEECYYYSGPMTVSIRNIDGNETTTLASFVGFVDAATDGNIGTPTPGGGGGYTIDNVPTSGSDNLVKSGGVYSAIQTVSQNSSNAISALSETVNDIDDRVDTLETTIDTKVDSSDLANYVQKTDYATSLQFGVTKIGNGLETNSNTNAVRIKRATTSQIKMAMEAYNSIVPYNQHESVFYGLAKAAGDTTQAESSNSVGTYTAGAKTAIKTMLGITDVDVSSLSTRLTTAESNISTLQTDTSDLEDRIADAEDDITALESTASSLGTRLTTAEGTITSHGTRLTTAEGSISSQGTRLTTAESDIDGLDTRVTALENGQGPSYVIDDVPTANSNNLVKSGGVYSAVNNVSGNVSTLSTSVNTLSTSVNTMQSSVSQNSSNISSLETRVSYLETNAGIEVEDITNDVTMVKSSGSNASLQGYEVYKCGNVVTFSITVKATGTISAGSAMAYIDVTGAPVPVIGPRAVMYYGSSIIFGNYSKELGRITVAVANANLAANTTFMLTFIYLGSDSEPETEPTNGTNSIENETI